MPRSSPPVEPVELVPWDQLRGSLRWQQGEHVALVGPTGAGKTTAALSLVELRRERGGFVGFLSTKPHDSTLGQLKRNGWRTVTDWPPAAGLSAVIVHAPLTSLADGPRVGAVIGRALDGMYRAGHWCVVMDDLQVLNDTCGLHRMTRMLLLNARSSKVSIVASTQRPRWVPREVWTQSTHLLIWRCVDADDLRALAGLGNADTDRVRATVRALDFDRHECLYVNTRSGRLARTVLPRNP